MAGETKYKKKFAQELIDGLRAGGLSINGCCRKWGVTPLTYYAWIKKYPEFAHAAEMGQLDAACWWEETHRKVASGEQAGNAACLNFAMKNVENIKWVDKSETHVTHDEQIHTLVIKTLPAFENKTRVIEHDEGTRNLPDAESS